jgi:hypothetical protein
MEAPFAALARPTAGCPSAAARDTAMGWRISEPWVTTLDQLVDALENVRILPRRARSCPGERAHARLGYAGDLSDIPD